MIDREANKRQYVNTLHEKGIIDYSNVVKYETKTICKDEFVYQSN